MAHRFLFRRRVEFAETDLAGIMHFANFFRFMEAAEHAFYRSLGFSVHPFSGGPDPRHGAPRAGGATDGDPGAPRPAQVGWPRVHASADFRLPLHFEEEVEVELLVEELRHKSASYLFLFWKHPDDPEHRVLAASGRFTVVSVAFDPESGRMKAVAIPDEWREQLSVAPPELIPERASLPGARA